MTGTPRSLAALSWSPATLPSPPGVDRQRLAQHELHAEVRRTAQCRLRMGLLKPGGRLRRLSPASREVIDLLAEGGLGRDPPELIPRDRLQHGPGIMREVPQHGIELPPHLIGGMVPRPAQIQRQRGEGLVSFARPSPRPRGVAPDDSLVFVFP